MKREYAYGPAQGLLNTKVGTLAQALYDETKKQGWTVISMKNDWKAIFSFNKESVFPDFCARSPFPFVLDQSPIDGLDDTR